MKRRDFLKGAGSLGVMSCVGWRLFAEERGLPAYYGDYLANIAAKVRSQAAKGRDAFWFLTDPHVPASSKMSGFVLAKLIRETGVRKVFCGGDIPCAFGTKADVEESMAVFREKWIKPIEAAGGRFHLAKGNHDFTIREGMTERGFTLDGRSARNYIFDSAAARDIVFDEGNPEGSYYYLDERESKIRYIVADTTDSIAGNRQYWAVENGIHERQLAWLRERAFGSLPKGWSFIVVHHIPVTGIVGSPQDEKTFEGFRKLLNAHSDRVVMDIAGHHHSEVHTWQNGIWHVCEPSDAMFGDYINRSKPWCPNLPVKKAGTVSENTFDAVVLDSDGAWIRFVRVGGGADRALSTRPVVLQVGASRRLDSSLGEVQWGCYDAEKAEFKPDPANKWSNLIVYKTSVAEIRPDGVLLAKKPGESVAVALASDGRKEMFAVRVIA